MASPEELAKLLNAESERLRDYLASVPDDVWSHPTACDEWDVATVVAHLTGAGDAFAERIERGLNGDATAPTGLPDAGKVNAESWAETNAQRWISIREGMEHDLLAAFDKTSVRFNQLIAGLKPEDLDRLCYHPGGVVPVRTLAGFRLLELAVHSWDIRSELESSARLSDESLPHLIGFISDYLEWFFVGGPALPKPVRYRFDFTDNMASNTYDIVVTGNEARMEAATASSPCVIFKLGAESFVLLMCGRVTIDSLAANGAISIAGDIAQASRFNEWFRGA